MKSRLMLMMPIRYANSWKGNQSFTRSAGFVLMAVLLCLFVVGVQGAAAATTRWVNDDDPNLGGYAPPGTSCNDPGYPTIQSAVLAAASGDTIQVCSGTYMENVVLDRSLKLLGAQQGVNACGRMAASESVVTPPLILPAPRILELLTGSAASIIDGFTFRGGTRAIESSTGPITDLQLLNNRIHQFTNAGVFLDDIGLNITANQNEIDGTMKVGGGGLFHLDTDNFGVFTVLSTAPGAAESERDRWPIGWGVRSPTSVSRAASRHHAYRGRA